MLKHLLIPLDGSRLAETAIPVAVMLARRAGAQITLLHVLERDAPATIHGDTHLTSADDANDYLSRTAREKFQNIQVQWHVHREQISHVAQSLANHAHEFTPDLIVMSSHGQPRLTQRLFGTIPQQIIQRTPTPVLLVQAATDQPFRHILLPLNGEATHEAAIELAATMAKLCDATLRLVMVVPTLGSVRGELASTAQLLPAATEFVLDLEEKNGAEYLAKHVERLRQSGVSCTAIIARGDPVQVLRQMILNQNADMVALATHGAAGTKAFWSGSMGQKLIGQSATSLLLVVARAEEPSANVAIQF